MGEKDFGHDLKMLKSIVNDIKQAIDLGVQVCIVVGGGNIYRGRDAKYLGIPRVSGDYMGMLSTVINAIAIQNILEQSDVSAVVQSAISMDNICESFSIAKAQNHMKKNRVVLFAAGIGNPYFSTDSAAVVRAIEMQCDYLLKGTNVDGVYSKDPMQYSDVVKYDKITYTDILKNNLKVMDMAAIAVARENNLPIKVFNIKKPGNFVKILQDQGDCTIIRGN